MFYYRIIFITFYVTIMYANQFNMQHLGHLEFDVNSSDITGFYQDGREIAVIGLYNGTAIIDITDPEIPVEIGRISGSNSIWRDIKYWNRYIYIGTEALDGIQIVDVNDLDNPILVNTLSIGNSHNIFIDNDGYLYILGSLQTQCDIIIYDLDDPSIPIPVGCWSGEYIHDIDIKNNKLYATAIYSSTVYILDISNKSSIDVLTSFVYPGAPHDCTITENEQILITADEMLGGSVKLWDITNYNNIQLLGEYMVNSNHSVHNIYSKDNLLYISSYADGIRVVDITVPTNPIEIAFYDICDDEGLYIGNWGVYPFLPSNNIIFSDIQSGLYITTIDGLSITHQPMSDQSVDLNYYQLTSRINSHSNDFDSALLNYKIYNGLNENWTSLQMQHVVDNLYLQQISKQNLGTLIEYYIVAYDVEGNSETYPIDYLENPLYFVIGAIPILEEENFEFSNEDWSIDPSDDAISGIWELGEPIPVYFGNIMVQPDFDHTSDGINCFITGNYDQGCIDENADGLCDEANQESGIDNVDNGKTTLISPTYDFSNYNNIMLEYWYWFSNNMGNTPEDDSFQVDISNDNGNNWININLILETKMYWSRKRINLSNYIENTNQMKIRFIASDYNNPSIIEAALDDIKIMAFGNPITLGDVNFDNSIDILDVVSCIHYLIYNIEFNLFELQASDMDGNYELDILDIVTIINNILYTF